MNSCTAVQLAGEIKRAVSVAPCGRMEILYKMANFCQQVAAAVVHLSPSTNHAVKIGYASWKPEDLAANAEKVVSVSYQVLLDSRILLMGCQGYG